MRIINSQKGDTILEVLVSMVVLAVVAGAAYATSTRSFHSALNSQYRDQAVTLAQQQIELLRSADSNTQISGFKTHTGAFCINSSAPTTAVSSSSPACSNVNNAYSVSTVYTGNPPGGTTNTSGYQAFKVTVTWLSAEGKTQTTTAYYKASDSFNDTASATCSGCSTSKTTNPPAGSVAIVVTPSTPVNYGSTVNVQWTINNIQNGTCNGTNWTFNGAPGQLTGSATSGGLTTTPSSNISLSCVGVDGTTVSDSKTVTVNKVTINNFSADSGASPIPYNTATTLRWSSSLATSCTGVNFSTGGAVSGAVSTGNLTSSATYGLNCAGPGGPASAPNVTVTVSSAPPPVINYFYPSPNPICYGCGTNLYWGSTNVTGCTWGGSSGSVGTGALYGNTGYWLTCNGPGGSTSAYTVVSVDPPPPPPPPPCSAWASGSIINGSSTWISGGGSSCDYFYDDVVGWNGGGTWGPTGRPICHTQSGGVDPWGMLSSGSWCSG
jgi:prepilin-type N-terminal cleavage/methylation domain-containing protein